METINIPKGFYINTQSRLNEKTYFSTLAELINLGTNNSKAYSYYSNMIVYCEETKEWYKWRELIIPLDATGKIAGNYTYPANFISFGVDYSGLVYNFFPLNTAKNITPHGVLNIKKVSTSTTDEVLESGDYVVNTVLTNDSFLIFGVYVAGDPLISTSYDQVTIQLLKPTS